MTDYDFEAILTRCCELLTAEARSVGFESGQKFEARAIATLKYVCAGNYEVTDFTRGGAYSYDVVIEEYGINFKLFKNDTWRGAETIPSDQIDGTVKKIYVMLAKMGSSPEVRWLIPKQSAIGRFIADLRVEKGLSQRELSDKSGISNTEISRLESGKRAKPSPETLRVIAKALDTEYSDLMRVAGYIEEKHIDDKFYKLFFKSRNGEIVDIKSGVKEMFRRDEEWANTAYIVSHDLSANERQVLKDLAASLLKNRIN